MHDPEMVREWRKLSRSYFEQEVTATCRQPHTGPAEDAADDDNCNDDGSDEGTLGAWCPEPDCDPGDEEIGCAAAGDNHDDDGI